MTTLFQSAILHFNKAGDILYKCGSDESISHKDILFIRDNLQRALAAVQEIEAQYRKRYYDSPPTSTH